MTVHLRIYGRVQGVFFRQSALTEARKLGLSGWVRNDIDGSVEAKASGDKQSLKKFIAWCRKGPRLSKVKRVDEEWAEGVGDFDSFEIID